MDNSALLTLLIFLIPCNDKFYCVTQEVQILSINGRLYVNNSSNLSISCLFNKTGNLFVASLVHTSNVTYPIALFGFNSTSFCYVDAPFLSQCDFVSNIFTFIIPPGKYFNGQSWRCEGVVDGIAIGPSNTVVVVVIVPVTRVTISPTGINDVVGIIEGRSQTFSCITDAVRPLAKIQWFIGEQNVTTQSVSNAPQQEGDKYVTSSTLIYTGKEKDYHKFIYCEATNFFGNIAVKSIAKLLHIEYGPKVITLEPSATMYTVKETDSVEINCSTHCIPECSYNWVGPGEFLANVFRFNLYSIHRNQSGTYFCHASNLHGNLTSSGITIKVIEPPVAPTVIFVVCKTTSAVVQWKSGFNGGLAQQFSIQYWNLENLTNMSQNVSEIGTNSFMQMIIENLLPSTEYIFSIRSYNVFWNSTSNIVSCKTDPKESCESWNQDVPKLFAAGISSLVLGLFSTASNVAVLIVCRLRQKQRKKNDNNPTYTEFSTRNIENTVTYETLGKQ